MNLPNAQLDVPANPPDAGTIIAIQFSKDWIPALLTALDYLRQPEFFLSPPSDIDQQIDELNDRIQNFVIISPQLFDFGNVYLPFFADMQHGSAQSYIALIGQYFGGIWLQSPAALDDEFSIAVLLPKASSFVTFFGIKTSSSGILTITTDEGHSYTQDFYSTTNVLNVRINFVFPVSVPGIHSISFKMHTKNASSSGYGLGISAIITGPD